MKTRMVLIAAALLLSRVRFGQGFSVAFYEFAHQLRATGINPPGCETGDPLTDATVIYVYQDMTGDGPSADDQLAPVGNGAGQLNFNQFNMNGESSGAGAGYFYTDPAFTSNGSIPTPNNWYLLIPCADGTKHYNTITYHMSANVHEIYADDDWTCTSCILTPPCNPTPVVSFSDQFPSYSCADLCTGTTTIIQVCRQLPFLPNKPPIVSIVPGCLTPSHCERDCNPAQFIYDPNAWVLSPTSNCWQNTVIGVSDGCVCIGIEGFLAVGFNNDFAAVSMDNSVKLTWSTSSQTGLSHYDIFRGENKVGEVAETNSANNYSFVDHSAVNGTSYNYSLRGVDLNGASSEIGTASATPSLLNAVVTEYALHQNFPNPFNPTTEITFDVVQKNFVSLKVYNAAGQMVGTVANGEFEAGRHIVSFNATNLPSGLYFYSVKIGNEFSATKKMLLVK